MKHYEFEINLLLDGELPGEESKELFAHLAGCDECCALFTQYMEVKEKSAGYCARYIAGSKNNRKELLPAKGRNLYKTAFYISSAAALFLIFFLFNQKPAIQYITKNQARVDTVFVPKEKQVIKYVKIIEYPEKSNKNYLSYLSSVPVTQSGGN